jgi:glycosyltransferase involved in cell wall biosynthesis
MSERPLRMAVDARCLNVSHLRGMGKMLYELVRRTAASGAAHWHLLADRPDRPMTAPDEDHVDALIFETKGHRLHAWEQWSLPNAARKLDVDLLHAAGMTAPWWQPVPTVVTIHDTVPWQQDDKERFTSGFYRDRLLPAAYHRAGAIITISNNSRRDILARWPALQQKLHVIPLGVDERYLDAEPDAAPLIPGAPPINGRYLLYLGGIDPRKRLNWALQAWWSSSTAPTTTMVVCGLEQFEHEAVRRMVPRHLHDRLVLAPFIGEEDMPRLYMRAAAVLYPTLYEGFGLPVVEAHAVGTPVLFSDVASLTELKGPSAVVLPVDDLPAWVRAIELVVQSPYRAGPDRIARAWARQYTWDACVERTLQAYAAALHAARPNSTYVSQGATL